MRFPPDMECMVYTYEISQRLPVGVLQDIPQNHRWRDCGVVAVSDVILEKLVLTHHSFQMA